MNGLPELEGRPIEVRVSVRTHPGQRRDENQDALLVLGDLGDSGGAVRLDSREGSGDYRGSGSFTLGEKGSIAVVADGMGGAVAGARASQLATDVISRVMLSRWGVDRKTTPSQFAGRLREAVLEANARIFLDAVEEPERRGMGTTVTAAGILQSFIYTAQVGDSRAYLVRNGDAVQITRDQSMTQELVESGALTPEEAEVSEHRNVILQALGTKPEVEVEITYQEVRRGDRLVLCSDGLSGVVRDDEVAGRIDGEEDLLQACEDLVAVANARGGPDNITVIALAFDGPGLDEPGEGDLPGRQVYEVDDS